MLSLDLPVLKTSCTTEEVLSYIQTLDVTKASGTDGISIRMLKHTATSIAPFLAKLFNISIKLGRFPTCWKTSSVVPVPKSSKHNEVANYRPISLLLVVSKLLERHIKQSPPTSMKLDHSPISSGDSNLENPQSQLYWL